jgi:microcin C transport system permease protein
MLSYILKRLLLIIPTLFGIMALNFVIIQAVPGGPIEQVVAKMKGRDGSFMSSLSGNLQENLNTQKSDTQIGGKGLDPEIIAEIKKQYGFDKPLHTRFFLMLKSYVLFDFGESFFKGRKVTELMFEKLPVSISLGLWTSLITYLIAIPLGIRKAVRDGSKFDFWTSMVIFTGYSIPSFLFAILLIILFAQGGYMPFFPLSGLVSDNFSELGFFAKIADYFYHLFLPLLAMVVSGFASLTMLTKNCFMEELGKQYVITARAKGLSENKILYGHIFRNAMLLVIAAFPAMLISILFTGALLIEIIFSLDGLGLLGFEAAINRDYPVIFATLYLYSFIGLVFNLIGDIFYHVVDPRINFEGR